MIISSKLAHPALKYCRDHRHKPLLTNLASQNANLTFSMTMYRQCERHSQMRNFPWTIGSKNWKICIVVDYLVAATNMGLPTWNLGIFIIIFWHLTLTAKAGAWLCIFNCSPWNCTIMFSGHFCHGDSRNFDYFSGGLSNMNLFKWISYLRSCIGKTHCALYTLFAINFSLRMRQIMSVTHGHWVQQWN